jgi:CRISPR-associated protein Csx17
MNPTFQLVPFPGINTDCLGHYLMGLGLLRAVSGRWSETRGCWHDGIFYLATDFDLEALTTFLQSDWQPTPYENWWADAQEADRGKIAEMTWASRSVQSVAKLRVGDCTLVPIARNQFNPLFGTGGNVGRRDLAKGWRDAKKLIAEKESSTWLNAALLGDDVASLPEFKIGGTWFVYNSERFNSGLSWSRTGILSPWAFLLAMEGALLVRGGSGRRLGARARPYAVFPFISQPLSPSANEEVGQKTAGEFWAPLWEQPATLGEMRALFQRGLARLGGRAATAPHEFAVAALAAGADAGVTHFVRFELRQTTSSQVYEALPRQTFPLHSQSVGEHIPPSSLLERLLGRNWFDSLPYEPARRDSKVKFSGLRGPLERLILSVAREPENPESWRELWLRLAATQARVDHNLNLRKKCRALPWLSWRWLERAFPGTPLPEIRLAAAFAALGAGTDYPAQCNVFGIDVTKSNPVFHQPGRPARVVWHDGEAQTALLDFVQRRLTDCDKENKQSLASLANRLRLSPNDIAQFLMGDATFMETIHLWLPPFTLLDWTKSPSFLENSAIQHPAESELLLWALFKPFFFPEELIVQGRRFFRETSTTKPAFSRQIFHRLRRGAVVEAIDLAVAGYHAQGFRIVAPVAPSNLNAGRIAAAIALPISAADLARLVVRWLEPHKQETKAKL